MHNFQNVITDRNLITQVIFTILLIHIIYNIVQDGLKLKFGLLLFFKNYIALYIHYIKILYL